MNKKLVQLIRTETLPVEDRPGLFENFKEEVDEEFVDYYVKGSFCLTFFDLFNPEIVFVHKFSREDISEPENKLIDILNKEKPKQFTDLLYISAVFNPFSFKRFKRDPFEKRSLPTDKLLDGLLKDTNGNIVFNHQLEAILQIAGKIGPHESRTLQSRWNNVESIVKKRISNMIWMDNRLLGDVLNERMLTDKTVFPPYKIALKLLKIL